MSNDMFGDLKEQILRNANISEEKIKKHLNESKPVAKPAAKPVAKPAPKKTLTSEIEKFKVRIMEEINQLVKDNLEDDEFGGTPPVGGEMGAALPPDTGAEGDQLAPPPIGDEAGLDGDVPPMDGAEGMDGGAEGPEVQALYDAAKEIFSKYGSDSEMIDKILNKVITELVPNAEVETQEMGGDEAGLDGDVPPMGGAEGGDELGMDDEIMGGGLGGGSDEFGSESDMDDEEILPKR